jgi:ribosomal protein L11 methylase PrmA
VNSIPRRDPGSFRDPSGCVYHWQGRVIRTVNRSAMENLHFAIDSRLLSKLAERGWIVSWNRPPENDIQAFKVAKGFGTTWVELIEHPRLPFVTYPYEWTFAQLKRAALTHLAIQMLALDHGAVLSDASAYNMQWIGAQPVHIDLLSFRKYRPGEIWVGYDQFCRQFLFPLLVDAYIGVPFQALYRGDIEGISVADIAAMLPWRRKYLSLRGYLHIALRSKIEAKIKSGSIRDVAPQTEISEGQYRALLDDLHHWISGLQRRRRSATYWAEYANNTNYSSEAQQKKLAFVRSFTEHRRPNVLWDLGGNRGMYSEAAIGAGTQNAIVIDGDLDALEYAFRRAEEHKLPLLPVYMDLANPSSNRGWREQERKGLAARAPADAVLGLALIHHLAISRNIPLAEVVGCIMALAPSGVLEFVPKSDPMVAQMLKHREDIFPDYTEGNFLRAVLEQGVILNEVSLTPGGRHLVSFKRRSNQ